jgi:uncharacterized membrane protein
MNFRLFIATSMTTLLFTGLLLLYIFLIFLFNFRQFFKLNYYQKIIILSLITLAIGIHGLIHLGAESVYGFNPYNWFNI